MSFPIVFLPEAREEFDSAANWYENRKKGLGRAFTLAINQIIERFAANPQIHAIVHRDIRKAVVRGYPYCVFYRLDQGNLIILSVFHASHEPNERQRRG